VVSEIVDISIRGSESFKTTIHRMNDVTNSFPRLGDIEDTSVRQPLTFD